MRHWTFIQMDWADPQVIEIGNGSNHWDAQILGWKWLDLKY